MNATMLYKAIMGKGCYRFMGRDCQRLTSYLEDIMDAEATELY
jgi:hypothetical protein